MPRSRAQKRLATNWINIVLTIISVTQGGVIGVLLTQVPNVVNLFNPVIWALFFLCLAISIRVFQTLVAGVLDDEFALPHISKFFFVLFVVSIEYYLFLLFGKKSPISINEFLIEFYKWAISLCVFAVTGYSLRLSQHKQKYKRHHKKRDDFFYTELWLQRRNILGMIAIMLLQLFSILSAYGVFNLILIENWQSYLADAWQIFLAGAMTLILAANTGYSIRATFGESGRRGKPVAQFVKSEDGNLKIKIARAEREDVSELRNLLMQYFGYIYKALFKNDEIIISKILKAILRAFGGRHALGYKSFYVAYPEGKREEIVGILLLKSSAEKWYEFKTVLAIIKLVLLNFGLKDLFQLWCNWQEMSGVCQKVKPDEAHIVYLAVNKNAWGSRVGNQLLEHARQIARNDGKNRITLCVRENNTEAKKFFLHQGFSIDDRAPKINVLPIQGAAIYMTEKL